MARLHLEIPTDFVFRTEIPVRATDVNYGGHVGNDSILSIMQEARIHYYRQLGFESELRFEGSIGQIIADAAIVYKSESFLGDVLTVQIAITEFNKYGFDMFYLITNKATGKEVAHGKTGIVCYDYDRKKVASIPESFLKKIKGNKFHRTPLAPLKGKSPRA
jgi:acyl-CoA thioester hydrolase